MNALLIMCAVVWICAKVVQALIDRHDRQKVQRIRSKQTRSYNEIDRLIEVEREQQRIAREQARQAEQLAKHEQRISDLEFRMNQAEADIEHWKSQIGNLYALLDIEQSNRSKADPGSKADAACQKRIITLTNQIHTAETRLAKAQHTRATAEQQLNAA